MTRIRGVDAGPNPREGEKTVPPMVANSGADKLHIYAIAISAEWIDKGSDRGKEFRMKFVDWCEGIPDPPNHGERFGEVTLYSECLPSFKINRFYGTWFRMHTFDRENPI